VKMKQNRRDTQEPGVNCSACGLTVPSYDIVHYGSIEQGYKQLCGQCFNQEVARQAGMDFEHAKFTPIGIADCDGKLHEFHFRTHLFGMGVALDGFEIHNGDPSGYWFQIIGAPEDDLLVLLGRLIGKIRRALSNKYLSEESHGLQIANRIVQGRIEWDDVQDSHVPLVVIDGQEVTWEEFGRMMMSFEGWNFQLKIHDKSEE
jgi:hypothetical protein